MEFLKIYEIGKLIPIGFTINRDEAKLKFIRFQYSSKEINTTALFFLTLFLLAAFFININLTLTLTLVYLGLVFGVVIYIYPTHIYYSQEIMDYNEQMLKAALSMSNYISMNSSIEYALLESAVQIRGLLRKEFEEIKNKLHRKVASTLGEVLEDYIPKWNSINPVFVKSLRLLQTASMSDEKDREGILKETIETLMLNFNILGKRAAEDLSEKAKGLISFGVLLPVTSLMILPLLSVFMANLVRIEILIFMYNVLFPTIMIVMALDFANKRIQVDTIDLKESQYYKTMPTWIYVTCICIVVFFAIPGIDHLSKIDLSTPQLAEIEYQFLSVFYVWLITLGIMIAVYLFTSYFVWLHKDLWKDVKETEDDLPHLLQIFSTYLSLNLSIEKIIPGISDDYKSEGFKKHPIVKVFAYVSRRLLTTKDRIEKIIKEALSIICPSKKVANILNQIISFSNISQESGLKAAKMIRQQTIAIYKLEDYMKTMLAETVGLINISITLMLPLLCAVAVIMSLVIVKSISYITMQLQSIQGAFGGGSDTMGFGLVDITKILPPSVLELIVGLYFIEMFLVLCIFVSKIKIGNDQFQLAKTINSNMVGYAIFSLILLLGHYLMSEVFFKSVFN